MIASLWFLYKRQWLIVGLIAIFCGYFWLSAFAAHERSSLILWSHVPPLKTLQFPWRFLSVVTFTASFLIGALFVLPVTRMIKTTLGLGLIIAVVALNIGFFQKEFVIHITDKQKLSGSLWDDQRKAASFDYLPIYAVAPPGRLAPGHYQIMQGQGQVTSENYGTDTALLQLSAATPMVLRFNLFDFPTWKVFIDNKQTLINHDNYLGLITIRVPSGNHAVLATLTNTPLRTLSNTVTGLTALLILLWGIMHGIRLLNRKQLSTQKLNNRMTADQITYG